MLCKKCDEQIVMGEPMRAEPVEAGSTHYNFFHLGCYVQIKDERQHEKEVIKS